MKKNKILLGILLIFVLLFTACRPMANERKNGEITEGNSSASGTQNSDESVIVSESGQQIKIPFQSKKGISEKLTKTKESGKDDSFIAEYTDETGNFYHFDENDYLVAYKLQGYAQRRKEEQVTADEKVVQNLADKCANAFCGTEFNRFKLEKIEYKPALNEYSVVYKEYFNDFVVGESLTVAVSAGGDLNCIYRPHNGKKVVLSEAELVKLTREKVNSAISDTLNASSNFSWETARIYQEGNEKYLDIAVEVSSSTEDYSYGKQVILPLSEI